MTFDDLQAGDAVFVDANTMIYHFTNHPKYGAACTRLMTRIEHKELQGFTLGMLYASTVASFW